MRRSLFILIILILSLISSGHPIIQAQSGGDDTPPPMSPEELVIHTGMNAWYDAGYPMNKISIGIIDTTFPQNLSTEIITPHPDQMVDFENGDNLRLADAIRLLDKDYARNANLYFYGISKPYIPDYTQAVEWFKENKVNIIVVTVAHPLLDKTETQQLETLISTTTSTDNLLWISPAGNSGQSYYEGSLRDGSHTFEERLFLELEPYQLTNSNIEFMLFYEIPTDWEENSDPQISLQYRTTTASECPVDVNNTEQIEPREVRSNTFPYYIRTRIFPPEGRLCVSISEAARSSTPIPFYIFIDNARIKGLNSSGYGSKIISLPASHPDTLTIGALEPDDNIAPYTSESSDTNKPDIYTYGSVMYEDEQEVGTLYAAMLATGIAAHYWSKDLSQTPEDIKEVFQDNASNKKLTAMGQAIIVEEDSTSWLLYIMVALVSGSIVTIAGRGFYVRNREKNSIRQRFSEESDVRVVYKNGTIQLVFMLPLDTKGKPELGKYHKTMDVILKTDPYLNDRIKVTSSLNTYGSIKTTGYEASISGGPINISKSVASNAPPLIQNYELESEQIAEKIAAHISIQLQSSLTNDGKPRYGININFSNAEWLENPPDSITFVFQTEDKRLLAHKENFQGKNIHRFARINKTEGPSDDDDDTNRLIFISYRRADTRWKATYIASELEKAFGSKYIFLDTSDIHYGDYWAEVLETALERTCIMLVMIGESWATVERDGRPRLEDPADWVRCEVETGLQNDNITVIPILIDTRLPDIEQLPGDILKRLPDVQTYSIKSEDIPHNIKQLVEEVQKIVRGKKCFE